MKYFSLNYIQRQKIVHTWKDHMDHMRTFNYPSQILFISKTFNLNLNLKISLKKFEKFKLFFFFLHVWFFNSVLWTFDASSPSCKHHVIKNNGIFFFRVLALQYLCPRFSTIVQLKYYIYFIIFSSFSLLFPFFCRKNKEMRQFKLRCVDGHRPPCTAIFFVLSAFPSSQWLSP